MVPFLIVTTVICHRGVMVAPYKALVFSLLSLLAFQFQLFQLFFEGVTILLFLIYIIN